MTTATYDYDDATYSDFYKEVHGVRPRGQAWDRWMAMTPDQKEAEWQSLGREFDRLKEEDDLRQQEDIAQFEREITNIMENAGAPDRTMALFWYIHSLEISLAEDLGYIEYLLHLPYGYLKTHFDGL